MPPSAVPGVALPTEYPVPAGAMAMLRRFGERAERDHVAAKQSADDARAAMAGIAAALGVPTGSDLKLDLDSGVITATIIADSAPGGPPKTTSK